MNRNGHATLFIVNVPRQAQEPVGKQLSQKLMRWLKKEKPNLIRGAFLVSFEMGEGGRNSNNGHFDRISC